MNEGQCARGHSPLNNPEADVPFSLCSNQITPALETSGSEAFTVATRKVSALFVSGEVNG